MSFGGAALPVLGIALAGVILGVLIRGARRRSAALSAKLREEIAASGERVLRGPERGLYCGATGTYSQVHGSAELTLTDRRLVVHRTVGAPIEVPVADMASVDEAKVFMASVRGGSTHLVIRLRQGDEVGLIVTDHAAWTSALRALVGAPASEAEPAAAP